MENESEEVKRENESFVGRLNGHKESIKDRKTKLEEEHGNSPAVEREFQRMRLDEQFSVLKEFATLVHK